MPTGPVGTGQTTLAWEARHTGHDVAMRAFCSMLVAVMPSEALQEVCEYLVDAYDFHTENQRLPAPSSFEPPTVTSATVTGRVSRPSLVL